MEMVIDMAESNCEICANYYYDEESEEYCCCAFFDEDELVRFMTNPKDNCPYFRLDDEYGIVRKQN